MTVITSEGYYFSGTPTAIVARLESLVASRETLPGRKMILGECRRVARYRQSIGPALADVAASNLIKGLAEDGHLLVKP